MREPLVAQLGPARGRRRRRRRAHRGDGRAPQAHAAADRRARRSRAARAAGAARPGAARIGVPRARDGDLHVRERARRPCPDDFGPLAAVLARAFYDDPGDGLVLSRRGAAAAPRRRFFAIRLRQLAGHGLIFTDEERSGAALWAPPGHWREDFRQSLRMLPMLPVLLPRIGALDARRAGDRAPPPGGAALLPVGHRHRPKEAGRRYRLRPACSHAASCDETGTAAYLESSKESNLSFYARHGFAVTERIELPEGPPLWLMWREPAHRRQQAAEEAVRAGP